MTPEEARAIAAELPEGGMRKALLATADRIERGDTSPVVLPIVPSSLDVELSDRIMPLLRDTTLPTIREAARILLRAREQGRQEIINCEACLPHDPCKIHSGR